MTGFWVWAPRAQRVDLVLADQTIEMTGDSHGCWRAEVSRAGHGTRYGFSLDGAPERPDPRSNWQPGGVDAASAVVDHERFRWSDRQWPGRTHRGAVLYELHIGTFTPGGTFDTAIERLPHLADLGVELVEIMPVAEFAGDRGWGYDGVALYAPHHRYGGPEGLKRLVDACHRHGIGVVLDVVYNHLGPSGNHLPEFGPYFSETHQTHWGAAVNFDGPGSGQVRRFVIDNALMWLRDYHVDGLRLDAVHAIIDDSALHILEELALEVEALGTRLNRPLFLIAESDRNDPRLVRSRDAGGFGLDAVWADEWHHALHASLTGERDGYYEDFGSLHTLAKALGQAWVYDGTYSAHRQRRHGRPPIGLSGHQLVVCTQNHDQVGNRAQGERTAHLLGYQQLAIAAALLFASPFTPMIFQGEEWGASTPFQYFTDHQEAELGEAVSRGRREEFAHFGWDPEQIPDPQDPATYQRSVLDWEEIGDSHHAGLLEWHRHLISLRRRLPDLADPRLEPTRVDVGEERTIEVTRGGVRLLANLGEGEAIFPVPGESRIHAASISEVAVGPTEIVLPGPGVVIVEDVVHGR